MHFKTQVLSAGEALSADFTVWPVFVFQDGRLFPLRRLSPCRHLSVGGSAPGGVNGLKIDEGVET